MILCVYPANSLPIALQTIDSCKYCCCGIHLIQHFSTLAHKNSRSIAGTILGFYSTLRFWTFLCFVTHSPYVIFGSTVPMVQRGSAVSISFHWQHYSLVFVVLFRFSVLFPYFLTSAFNSVIQKKSKKTIKDWEWKKNVERGRLVFMSRVDSLFIQVRNQISKRRSILCLIRC